MKVCREFYFDAAHHLKDYKGECEKVHGHTYKLEVVVSGKPEKDGMVMDFTELKKIVEETVIDKLDHADLNKIFDNPTTENIASWVYNKLEDKIPVFSVKLWEGNGKWAKVEGE